MTLVGVEPSDAAVEIGPGTGQLTRPLARIARRTLALEIDRGLVRMLADEGDLPPTVETWSNNFESRGIRALLLVATA